MFFLAVDVLGRGLSVPPFFENILIPAIITVVILLYIGNKVLSTWGLSLW